MSLSYRSSMCSETSNNFAEQLAPRFFALYTDLLPASYHKVEDCCASSSGIVREEADHPTAELGPE